MLTIPAALQRSGQPWSTTEKRPNTNHGAWKISRICGVTSCWSFPSPELDLSGPTLYFPPEYKKSMCSLTSLMHMWWRQFIKDSSVRVDVVTSLQKSFFAFFFFFYPMQQQRWAKLWTLLSWRQCEMNVARCGVTWFLLPRFAPHLPCFPQAGVFK